MRCIKTGFTFAFHEGETYHCDLYYSVPLKTYIAFGIARRTSEQAPMAWLQEGAEPVQVLSTSPTFDAHMHRWNPNHPPVSAVLLADSRFL